MTSSVPRRPHIAVAALAATAICACRAETGRRTHVEFSQIRATTEFRVKVPERLEVRWLVAPRPDQDPPLVAPIAIAASPETGRVLLLEIMPPETRAYALSSGRLVRRLGRTGDGPGEHRFPRAIAVNRAGLTAVLDMNGRVSFWNQDGTLRGSIRSSVGLASDIVSAGGDTFIVKTDIFPPADVAEFRRVTPDGAAAEPFFSDRDVSGTLQPGRATRLHAYPVAATQRGDLLIAPPGPNYRILVVGSSGQVGRTLSRPDVAPLRRSDAEIEQLRAQIRKGFAAGGHRAPAEIRVPEYRAHITSLAEAPDGTLWAATGRGDASQSVIDVFDAGGAFAGSYTVDIVVVDLEATADALYFLTGSADGLAGIALARRPRIEQLLTVE